MRSLRQNRLNLYSKTPMDAAAGTRAGGEGGGDGSGGEGRRENRRGGDGGGGGERRGEGENSGHVDNREREVLTVFPREQWRGGG